MHNNKNYFDPNSTVDVLYFTSDNLAFFDMENARKHAATLDDKTIRDLVRDEVNAGLADLDLDNWDKFETDTDED